MGCGQSSQADYARALSVERMRLEPTNARLQARECGYLAEAALTSSKCSPEERDAILAAMWRHIDVVHVQRNACRALQNNAAKLEAGSECVVVEALTRAIRRHRHEPDVIEHALSALGNLRFVCDDITSYALGVVVKAMEYHGLNARVQDAGMQALSQTSQQDDLNVQAIAREPRILACIVTAIRRHPGAPNMLSCACLLLECIAAHPETTGEALEDMAGLFKSLIAVMRAYPETPKLQRHVCAAMVALSRRNEAAGVQFSALGDALGIIVATMNIHRAVEEVQAEACEAISRLASMDAAHSHDAMRRTRNLFDVVVAAMGDYVSSVQIQKHALSVLFLASYSPDDNADAAANREAIGKVPRVWWRIATAMRRHKRVTSVQEHAFAVLTYLALNNESNQLAIVSEPGAVLAISAALTRHPSCPELQARGCKALATLVTNPATWPALRGMPGLEAALRAAFAHDAELRTSVSSVRLKDFDAFLGLAARPPSVDQLITSEPADAKLEDTEPVSTSSMDSAVPGAVVVAGPHQPGSLDSGM